MTVQSAAAPQSGQVAALSALRTPAANLPDVSAGFGSLKSFELMQRMASLLCASTLVPVQYRSVTEKLDKYGNVKERKENPNALANAVVALNMAQRLGADPLMIMQNLYVIEGRPSWSSQFIVAAINSCGRFSPLRFALKELGQKSVECSETFWEDGKRQSRPVVIDIADVECIAWALELGSGERLESPPVTIELAVKEGWYTKTGSKWQTMPQVMLRYRAASFFGKLYAPELLMGLRTVEEEQDVIEVSPETGEVLSVTTETLRADIKKADVQPSQPTPPAQATMTSPVTPAAQPAPPAQDTDPAPPAPPSPEPEKENPAKAAPPRKAELKEGPKPAPTVKESSAVPAANEPGTGSEQMQESGQLSPRVKSFMREINEASAKGSLVVDQWRMKHRNRVANTCGGVDTEDFNAIMDYADMIVKELEECEAAAQQEGKGNGSVF
jgi:hypothetical protein